MNVPARFSAISQRFLPLLLICLYTAQVEGRMDLERSTNPLDHPGVVAAAAASPVEVGGHQEPPSQTGETAIRTKERLFTIQVTLSCYESSARG